MTLLSFGHSSFRADGFGLSANPSSTLSAPPLAERFLAPPGFTWGGFSTPDGAVLRWGHLAAEHPHAECVLVGGFGDFIEKQFETIRDLAARGISVWCLDWRGQGGSTRPKRWPHRPRGRRFERDANELAAFADPSCGAGSAARADRAFDGRRDRPPLPPSPSPGVSSGDPVGADAGPPHRQGAADLAARGDRAGAADAARLLPAAGHLSLSSPAPADAGAQPHLKRRRALLHPPRLGVERTDPAPRPADLWLARPGTGADRAHRQAEFPRGDQDADPDRQRRPRTRRRPGGALPRRAALARLHARRAARTRSTSRSWSATPSATSGSRGSTRFLAERLGEEAVGAVSSRCERASSKQPAPQTHPAAVP